MIKPLQCLLKGFRAGMIFTLISQIAQLLTAQHPPIGIRKKPVEYPRKMMQVEGRRGQTRGTIPEPLLRKSGHSLIHLFFGLQNRMRHGLE